MTTEEIKEYIIKVRWQKAKDGSHEYTMLFWKPELEKEFRSFVKIIKEQGYKDKFNGYTYTYYRVDEYIYWTMFNRVESTILINRKPHKKNNKSPKVNQTT